MYGFPLFSLLLFALQSLSTNHFKKIDELWDSSCQGAVGVISKALHEVDNAESILKIKNLIALFMQTMNVCESAILSVYRKLMHHADVELPSQGV